MNAKKIFGFITIFLIFASCSSSKITNYAEIPANCDKIFVSLNSDKTSVTVGFFGEIGYVYSEDAVLGTLKNNLLVKEQLEAKGYTVVSDESDAQIIVLGESTSSPESSEVVLAFYEKETNTLLFVAEGEYGWGSSAQGDVVGALKKALEVVPAK